jgi:hypothetical protein
MIKIVAVVAIAALSMAGGSVAGSKLITSKQIKDRTIRLVDLHPSAVAALRAKPLSVVSRDGDSRTVAAGSAAELSARCREGETPIGATWGGVWGSIRDVYVFQDFVAAVVDNTRTFDVTVQLRAVCVRRI